MLRGFVLLFVICVSVAGSAAAQGKAPAAQANPLADFEPYIGGTWVSERAGRDGTAIRTERVYAWTLGGRFLEVREKSTGGNRSSSYFAILGVDPSTKALTAWSFTSRGETFFMRRAEADGLVFLSIGDGPMYRMTIRRTGSNTFEEVTEIQREGAWVPAGRQSFTRVAP
ncbi:MAG TPA: hypothetical protein VGA40_10610 [Candidatus Acidoferrales bacterium]